MRRRQNDPARAVVVLVTTALALAAGCVSREKFTRCMQANTELRDASNRLERTVARVYRDFPGTPEGALR